MTNQQKPYTLDWTTPQMTHRRLKGGGHQQALAKAIGITPNNNLTVIDATAGLGRDAFILASLGCQITLIENNKTLYQQLQQAWQTANQNPQTKEITQRIKLINANSLTQIPKLAKQHPIDVIYLDPMYPTRPKTAAVKKEAQYLQSLTPPQTPEEIEKLLTIARQNAKKRIILKRPKWAPHPTNQKPTGTIKLPNTLFEIYPPQKST